MKYESVDNDAHYHVLCGNVYSIEANISAFSLDYPIARAMKVATLSAHLVEFEKRRHILLIALLVDFCLVCQSLSVPSACLLILIDCNTLFIPRGFISFYVHFLPVCEDSFRSVQRPRHQR